MRGVKRKSATKARRLGRFFLCTERQRFFGERFGYDIDNKPQTTKRLNVFNVKASFHFVIRLEVVSKIERYINIVYQYYFIVERK